MTTVHLLHLLQHRRPGLGIAVLAGLVTACSPASAPPSPADDSAAVAVAPDVVAQGLQTPWGLTFLPGGDALVGERDTGRIVRLTAEGTTGTAYEVPDVAARGEGGLLGLAASPSYAEDGLVYAYLTTEDDNRVVRFHLDDPVPEVVVSGIDAAGYHNGGRIAFGPDGMLYVGTGDAGDSRAAQDPADLNGKILRVTPDGEPAPGNPTAGSAVYSLGHRNVQGLAWDGAGRMYATEFGQNELDEVNLIEPGHDYGWPDVEGFGEASADDTYTDPLLTWPVDEASPSGLAIVGDTAYAAALRGERLWTVPLTDGGVGVPRAELAGTYGRLRTVDVAPDGSLWVTTSNTDGRGEPSDTDDRILRLRPE